MTFIARKDATKEEQIAEAAAYAGVPAAVIDGIWRTESNRGQHATMVGPDTKWGKAKGHFQQLDGIVNTWSKRIGKELDPFDFSDGLTMTAHQLKENMGIFKGSVDKSVMAYFGGTDPAKWGPKTRAYWEKVTGQSLPADSNLPPALPRTQGTIDGEGKRPHMSAEDIWTADDAAVGILDGAEGSGGPYQRTFDIRADSGELLKARQAEHTIAVAKQADIDNRTFFGDVLPAAYQNTMNPTFRFMQRLSADAGEYEQDPVFMQNQRDNWAKSVEGYREPHEHEFLLNAVNAGDFARRKFHLDEQKRTGQIVADDGVRGLGAMFLAGAADPSTYIVGVGAMKAMYSIGHGAITLAKAGRPGAAVGSAVVENAAGNVAYEAMLQAFGEHRTPEDYALAGLMGIVPAGISAPGLYRTAVNEAARKHLADHAKKVLDAERAVMEQVAKDLGEGATPEQIKAEVDRRKAGELAKEVNATRGRAQPTDRPVVVQDPNDPEVIKQAEKEIEAERKATETPPKAEEPNPAQPKPADDAATRKLPEHLAKAKPTYSFGGKRFTLTFETDVERAGYIIADGARRSKADGEYLKFVMESLGMDEAQARHFGAAIREWIKTQARAADGGSIHVAPTAPEGKAAKAVPEAPARVNSSAPWRQPDGEPTGKTVREILNEVINESDVAVAAGKVVSKLDELRALAARLLLKQTANGKVFNMPVKWSDTGNPNVNSGKGVMTLTTSGDARPEFRNLARVHESVHTATVQAMWAVERGVPVGKQTAAAVKKINRLYEVSKKEFDKQREQLRATLPRSEFHFLNYAFTNNKEFVAQALSDHNTQKFLMGIEGAKSKTVWRELVEAIADLMGLSKGGSRLDEVLDAVDNLLRQTDTQYQDRMGNNVDYLKTPKSVDPIDIKYGLDTLPDDSPVERAKKKAIRELYRQAEEWAAKNPRNDAATQTVMDNKYLNMATPGTLLAQSDNPVARWVSAALLEQTMGAHGRGPNAAIAAHVLAQEYAGRFTLDFNNLYAMYRNERVGLVRGTWNDVLDGKMRKEFNTLVAEEIEGRLLGYPSKGIKQIVEAADIAQRQFELMRQEQITNKTPGFGALPETSIGYLPHLLDSAKVASMSLDQRRAYIAALADQFKNGMEDMSDEFAEKVARAYVKHATDRAHGLSDIPADPLNHNAAEYIRAAAEAAGSGLTPEELRALNKVLSRGAASHTKKRLKMDTLKEYTAADGTTFRLLDLFRTDMNDLVRGHARRVAGDVALTRFGVQGSAGLALIKEALSIGPQRLSPDQDKAMKQVFSELMGRPVDLSPESQFLNGITTYASLTKLGGMGFTQLGEYSNMALHVGLGHTFDAVSSFPRLLSEICAIARGEKVENGIIGSMEFRGGGGEFGLEGYHISHYDTTGREFEAYGQSTAGPLTRALKKAQYGMGIVSFHRAIQAVQQRGAAEQVTLKALRLAKEGGHDKALADMGFDAETLGALRQHLDTAVEWNGGRVKSFDITKLPADLQERFHQGVRRGVYQIIQGTFIGERGHWNHSQLGRLLTQFRNYPLTAMEKQLGRTITVHGGGARGAAVAAGMVIAAAGMVLPVYGARVAFNAMTRDDRDEYIDRMMAPDAVLRNVMNYIGMMGMLPDLLDGMFAIAQGVGVETGLMEGAENRYGGQTSLGSIIPAVGSIEQLMRAPENVSDVHKMLRLLPYSNTPLLVPFIEALRGE